LEIPDFIEFFSSSGRRFGLPWSWKSHRILREALPWGTLRVVVVLGRWALAPRSPLCDPQGNAGSKVEGP
jgi:hypothetical protein